MNDNTITYEQPLNELTRVCLRLEQLFQQLDHQFADTSLIGTRNIIVTMINILHLLDRPDFKAKLAKELGHHMTLLARLENTAGIDHTKLQTVMKQLDELSRWFIESSGKIGQSLREIELLNNLRLHLATPGGGCSFDIPVYYYWLQQPVEQRFATIRSWLNEFANVRIANELILQLSREGSKSQQKTAQNGFHQELLDPQNTLRMIRIAVSNKIAAYPEISIGRHFLSIRFFSPAIIERPSQYQHDLVFSLYYCS